MQTKLTSILQEAKDQLAAATTLAETEEVRVRLLGKKGQLTEILRSMGSLDPEERKVLGQAANSVRSQIESLLEDKFTQVKNAEKDARFRAELSM